MKRPKKQYLVIGLGRFGQSLALDLVQLGAEVFGVDQSEEAVTEVADRLTHSAVANTTEAKVIEKLGVDQFDSVICAIGGDLEASVMTALLVKEQGARNLVAKANSRLHGKILERLGVDQVLFPEREVASRLARDFMASEQFVEVFPLTVQHSMFELKSPPHFAGRTLQQLHLRKRFGLTVIAIRRAGETVVSPGPEEVIRRDDVLLVVGDRTTAEQALQPED